ncbi:MAG TPA: glycoside hydrolase [Clostridia bacterium]|nr:glycoside hydrolase [Clostridia bacterium]
MAKGCKTLRRLPLKTGAVITGFIMGLCMIMSLCSILVVGGLVTASRTGSSGMTYQDKDRFAVLAYYASDSPYDRAAYASLSTDAGSGAIDAVAAFLHPINGRGLIGGKPDASLMRLARKNGLKVLAVVHNFIGGGFSRQVASDILADPNTRGAASGSIVWILKEYGYDGVNVDLENIDPALRDEYVAFLAELAQKMRGSGKLLTVCMPGKTYDAPKDQWTGAFDYARIGRIADKVVIMAYDEHWVGGDPGPIASFTWVQSVLKYATRAISPDRILLGLAAYGYDWPTSNGKAVGMGRMLGAPYLAEVARSSGATIIWDDWAQVPYFKYWRGTQEHTVYFENKYSAAFKIALARKFGLGGVAVWRLGLEDPGLWRLLSKY